MYRLPTTLALLGLLLVLQTLHLGRAVSTSLSFTPRQPAILAVIRLRRDTGLLRSATNLPVRLTVHITRAQLGALRGIRGSHTRNHNPVRAHSSRQIRARGRFLSDINPGHRNAVQLPPAGGIPRRRQLALLLEADADVLAVRMALRVQVVPDVAGLGGVDGVVSAQGAVLTGEPLRPPLPEDDASRHDVLSAGALRAESLSRWVARVSVACTLGGVRGVADLGEGEEKAA